jgi:hypothetical protein
MKADRRVDVQPNDILVFLTSALDGGGGQCTPRPLGTWDGVYWPLNEKTLVESQSPLETVQKMRKNFLPLSGNLRMIRQLSSW